MGESERGYVSRVHCTNCVVLLSVVRAQNESTKPTRLVSLFTLFC